MFKSKSPVGHFGAPSGRGVVPDGPLAARECRARASLQPTRFCDLFQIVIQIVSLLSKIIIPVQIETWINIDKKNVSEINLDS